jgi:hypothetical protein
MRSAYGHNANIGNDVTRQVKTSQDKTKQVRYNKIQLSPTQAYALYREKREDGKKRDLISHFLRKPSVSSTVVRNACDEV